MAGILLLPRWTPQGLIFVTMLHLGMSLRPCCSWCSLWAPRAGHVQARTLSRVRFLCRTHLQAQLRAPLPWGLVPSCKQSCQQALPVVAAGAVVTSVHKVQFPQPKDRGPAPQRFPRVLLDKTELVELKRTLPKGEC